MQQGPGSRDGLNETFFSPVAMDLASREKRYAVPGVESIGGDGLLGVVMAGVEVEDVDGGEGDGFGVDAAGGDGGGVPVLVLEVGFDGEVMGEVVVEADAGGEDQ